MTELALHPAQIRVPRPSLVEPPPAPTPPQALRLIVAVLEAMMGRRALHQLRPHLELLAFGRLVAYVEEGRFRHSAVGGIRSQMPTGTAVEASVRLASSARWITCAMRLDAAPAGWRCSDLLVLQPTLR